MASPEHKAPYSLPTIPGYTLTEQLYSSPKTAVYRAIAKETQQLVVIKVLQQAKPNFQDLVRFRHQYEIARDLPISGITRPLSLKNWQDGYALVMEDFGGVSLAEYVKARSIDLIQTLTIGVQIAEILHDLIQHRLIHKDIKPANILIHPDSGQIKLTDFSISSLLPKETQQLQTANELAQALEGTLSYLAPEQTGRMNRGIDYRADFYALGVTLYELLTGELPFPLSDPLALVHAHIAREPVAPHEVKSSIPPMVSAIALKLMAKNAEDRYQSAAGLKVDLEKCLHALKETGRVAEFDLAQQDVCDRFFIPEKLYGRQAEVKTLLDAFNRVATPQEFLPEALTKDNLASPYSPAEIVLIAGSSGIGKTAIVKEVHKPMTQRKGYFIQGKFDQFNRNTPFSAFVIAFRSLIIQLSGETETALSRWKTSLSAAIGDDAQVIINVIPELESLLGSQPAVAELSGAAAQARFNRVFGEFVRVFAQLDHPLVIFLDDLQWADAASLTLLDVLITEAQLEHLLILGAYRDNEVFAAHPLMLTLSNLTKQGTPIHTLSLAPLSQPEIAGLVADTLHCSALAAGPLAELIYQKTQGNPFFTTQFLKGLQAEGCIVFDADLRRWQCDLARAQQLAATDDVVTFLISRLQKLPAQTQAALKLAACLGNQFDLHTLSIICQKDLADLSADLWASLQEGFILLEGGAYAFSQGDRPPAAGSTKIAPSQANTEAVAASYCFLHDRVQQAAYVSIPEGQRASIHCMIGQRLLKQLSEQKSKRSQPENLFEVVNHLNLGESLIECDAERTELAELNLAAGK
ncbi:MAG: serine/threonine-protein kinase PknK, partial [Phormidesmis sp.]